MLQRLAPHGPALGDGFLSALEHELRRDWGGDRPYIAKSGESARAELSQRDARIQTAHRRGDHVPVIARREGVSERRVRQILAAARQEHAPAGG